MKSTHLICRLFALAVMAMLLVSLCACKKEGGNEATPVPDVIDGGNTVIPQTTPSDDGVLNDGIYEGNGYSILINENWRSFTNDTVPTFSTPEGYTIKIMEQMDPDAMAVVMNSTEEQLVTFYTDTNKLIYPDLVVVQTKSHTVEDFKVFEFTFTTNNSGAGILFRQFILPINGGALTLQFSFPGATILPEDDLVVMEMINSIRRTAIATPVPQS